MPHSQVVPIRLYDREQHIVLAAPLPGLEADNISVEIRGDHVVIDAAERGPGQHQGQVICDEWTIGPYHREVTLPEAVSGSLTNATYGNGVLVLSMPKGQAESSEASFRLTPVASARGERVGHKGMDIEKAGT